MTGVMRYMATPWLSTRAVTLSDIVSMSLCAHKSLTVAFCEEARPMSDQNALIEVVVYPRFSSITAKDPSARGPAQTSRMPSDLTFVPCIPSGS